MFKKLGNYYLSVFKKYGVVIPAVVVAVAYALLITVEATNALGALLKASKAAFIVIGVLAAAGAITGIVFSVLKLKNKAVSFIDLGLTLLAAITLLMLIMFCFATGTGWFAWLKWCVTAALLIISVVFAVLRSKNVG